MDGLASGEVNGSKMIAIAVTNYLETFKNKNPFLFKNPADKKTINSSFARAIKYYENRKIRLFSNI